MIFSRNFIIVAVVNFLLMTAYYLLFVISSPYAAETFGATPSTAGLVAGLILIGCLTGRFFTGRIVTQVGFVPVLFTGIGIYTASLGLYLAAGSLPSLMAVRFLSGVGIGCIGTVTGTLIVHIVPPHLHGQGINYFSCSTILALALGPFFGLQLMRLFSFPEIFVLCAGLGVVSLLLATALRLPAMEKGAAEEGGENSAFRLRSYIEYAAVPIGVVVLLVSAAYGSLQAFMAFYAAEAGLDGTASVFFLVYAVTGFCLRPFAGKVLDRRNANFVIYPALVLACCGFMVLGATPGVTGILFAGVLVGAGVSNLQTAVQTVSVRLVEKRRFGPATSTYFILLDLGIGVGPYFLGFIVPYAGYAGVFQAGAVLALVSIPLYYVVHGRKIRRA